jgi:hypothetical protein
MVISYNYFSPIVHTLKSAFQYEFPMLKEHMDKSIVEVCSLRNAIRLHDVAVLHNLNEDAQGIQEFIGK